MYGVLARLLIGVPVALCLLAHAGAAQEGPPAASAPAPWRNHVNIFGGVTREGGEGASAGLTLGVDYERRVRALYGIGVLAEMVFSRDREFLLGAQVNVHPAGALRLTAAPVAERGERGWAFLMRLGADYDFEWAERWTIAPSIALDFVRGRRTLVLGASLGRIF